MGLEIIMPYTKLNATPFIKMRRLLLGYELTPTTLSAILGVCRNTARARLENPGKLTLEDLYTISRKAHIPIEEIREVIVVRVAGGMYTLKFTDTGGGVKLREGRLYSSKEAAEDAIKSQKKHLILLWDKVLPFQKVA